MKRCFVVCGPESAGNRLLAAHLQRAGCHGNASTEQDYFPGKESPAFVIRSLPHGEEWPDLKALKRKLERRDYRVTFLVTVRDPFSLVRSQLARGHQDCAYKAIETVREAYRAALIGDYYLVPYEALTQGYDGFLGLLGLPRGTGGLFIDGEPTKIQDGNKKHYG